MTAARRPRPWALLAALVAALLLTAVSAVPVLGGGRPGERHGTSPPSWSPPLRVSDGTGAVPLAAGPDGSTWGVTRLPGPYAVVPPPTRLVLLHRDPGGAWTSRALPVTGFPLGVADDGRSTSVVYRTSLCTGAREDCRLRLLTVPRSGRPAAPRELQRGDVVGAALAADERGWWAVWTLRTPRPDGGSDLAVRQARSSEPTPSVLVPPAPQPLGAPRLALRGDGAVVAVVRERRPGDAVAEVWSVDAAGRAARAAALRQQPGVFDVGLAVSGRRTSVTVWDGTRLVLAQDRGDLVFARRTVPTPTDPRALPPVLPRSWPVAAGAGRVFVAYDVCATPEGARLTCRTWVAQARGSGPLRTTEVSARVRAPDGRQLAVLGGLTATGGRAVVAFESPLLDPFTGPSGVPGVFVRTSG